MPPFARAPTRHHLSRRRVQVYSIMRSAEFAYKQDHPMEKRSAEAARIREKYPDRIPVICEKDPRSDIPPVDKRKYLIPMDLTVGQFVYVIRKRISIPSDKAIFIFVNNTLPPTAALMSTVYEQHRDADGFMYMMYSGENTFGALEALGAIRIDDDDEL